ncbi:hypothetical protein ACJZ2D_017049 [Fusarium nematophilum]
MLRDTPRWVSVKRLCPEYEFFVRNDEEYLFCGTRSHARLDGSHRWGLHRLDLRSRQWSDPQLVLWEFDGSSLGMDICFEIIDGYFYCVSNTMKTQTDHRIRNYYYQAVRFPVKEATHESCEKPLLHNLWRRHGSEGAVDERWTSLQLVKDEDSGKLLIVEIRREWLPENSGIEPRSRQCLAKKTVKLWPQDQIPPPIDPINTMSQLSNIVNPTQPVTGFQWGMDERILVYSPTYVNPQPLRPIILVSFDPALRFSGFPKFEIAAADAGFPDAVAPRTPQVAPAADQDDLGSPSGHREGSNLPVNREEPLYKQMRIGNGIPHGFDMSYYSLPESELLG